MKALAFLSSLILLAASCGSKSPPTTPTGDGSGSGTGSAEPVEKQQPETGSGSAVVTETPKEPDKPVEPPPPPPPPEPDAFMKLTKDEKTKIMKTKVLPAMAKAFKTHDGKKFGKFTCKSCHGKGADTDFKMPNPDLPPLDFEALKDGKQAPKTAEFMGKVVLPEMVKMLGVQAHDDTHPNGFGCLTCHTMKETKAP